MTIKGIIFDLDGVLVHTDELHYLAWKELADRLGIYFDRSINERLRGVSRMASLEIILGDNKLSDTEKEVLADEKNEKYRSLLGTLKPSDVSDEVRKTLATLKEKGIKLAIGSSSKNAKFILQQIGLIDEFDAISDGNNITRSKPDPEVFLKAAEFLDLPPAECIVVEDAQAGIAAANAGGFISAGYGSAASDPDAKHTLNTLSDLVKLI